MKAMWMVRGGTGGQMAPEFRSKGVIAIGFTDPEAPVDWTKYGDRAAIKQKVGEEYPDHSRSQIVTFASQVYRFLREFSVGDHVITYHTAVRHYFVGEIIGDPTFKPGHIQGLPMCRQVKWLGEVSRDSLSVSTRNSLGAISTLFRVPPEAAAEIEAVLSGRPIPLARNVESAETEEIEEEQDVLKDIQARAHEFLKDKLSRLDWEQMQQLVAGLLRAMGYKTRVSPLGPDRGKDVVASPDGFGFESPRIVVEVKHRRGTMGAQDIRSFVGGRHKDDKGLYVSTGGFSREAQYEAERSSIPLTLMDMDDLAQAVGEYYDHMDMETRALIPLIRIYWPVS